MKTREITIFAKDKEVIHNVKVATVFTTKYFKKIKNNEHHSPKAAKLIIENDHEIIRYLLINPLIISDKNGKIKVYSSDEYEKLTGEIPFFNKKEISISNKLVHLYENKKTLGLSVEEVIEKDKSKSISELQKLLKHKVPFEIGGGL